MHTYTHTYIKVNVSGQIITINITGWQSSSAQHDREIGKNV